MTELNLTVAYPAFNLKGIVCGDGMVQGEDERLLDECMVCSDQKR